MAEDENSVVFEHLWGQGTISLIEKGVDYKTFLNFYVAEWL